MVGIWYGLYVFISVIGLVYIYRRDWQNSLIRIIIVVVFPLIGWLFPLFWPKRLYRHAGSEFHEYITQQHEDHKLRHVGIYSEIEAEKELNIIPIEEALLVSEHHDRRRVMIDVLKQDSAQYLEILQIAVRNEDTETSHYAVSAIMEAKRKLLIAMQDLSVQYENRKDDIHVVRTYAEVLKGYLKSGFLDERTILKYRYTYLQILEQLTRLSNSEEWAFREKMETELALGLYIVAESTSIQYMERHPDSEDGYLCLMKVHYETRSYAKLRQTLEQLKHSPIRLSNRGIMNVRFWSEVV